MLLGRGWMPGPLSLSPDRRTGFTVLVHETWVASLNSRNGEPGSRYGQGSYTLKPPLSCLLSAHLPACRCGNPDFSGAYNVTQPDGLLLIANTSYVVPDQEADSTCSGPLSAGEWEGGLCLSPAGAGHMVASVPDCP